MTKTGILLTLIVGAACVQAASIEAESEAFVPSEQLIESQENAVGKRTLETPQVVLQLKYDDGELNRIYLAQFRTGSKSGISSVPVRNNLCADLCHAGLGGAACGESCADMIPVGLQSALTNASGYEVHYGEPRVDVCPTLCENHLGQPLCNCHQDQEEVKPVEWNAVCAAFCLSDKYVLGGCPSCGESSSTSAPVHMAYMARLLTTTEGWAAWCDVQCRQGHGGAACNCDRAPFQ